MIRNFDDLTRAAEEAKRRHAIMRRARLLEITASIEAAIHKGKGQIGQVLSSLSERERYDLLTYFPEILERLSGARNAREMSQVLRGAQVLLSQGKERRRTESDIDLALRAFVTARVPESRHKEAWEKLREIERSSRKGILPLMWLWIRYRLLRTR